MSEPDPVVAVLLDRAFELSPLPMALLGADQRVLRANGAACRLLGYTAEELPALPPQAITRAEDRAEETRLRDELAAATLAGYARVKSYLHRDGSEVPAREHCVLVRGPRGEHHFVLHIEPLAGAGAAAPERKPGRIDGELLVQEQASLLDHTRDAIVLHGPDQRIGLWNRGAERLYGYRREQAIGRTWTELVGAGGALPEDARRQLAHRGDWIGVLECIDARGQAMTVERRCSTMDGPDGRPTMVLSVDSDVTEQRRAEKEIVLLNNLLEQRIRSRTAQLQESNEDLRGLAYSLAHDLRAPLASVDAFAAQLERRLDGHLDARSSHYLQRMRAGVRLMSQLTDGLLALANLSSAPLLRHSVDLSALAHSVIARLREGDPARRVAVLIEDTPRVEGDVRMLTDLMEHLLGNAWKFTARTDGARIEFGGAVATGGGYRYGVRDNGAGFDPDYAYKLFNAFQRLHPADEFPGTGIGLAMARKIVTRHHGSIWAESRPGAGAAFWFTLGDRRGAAAAGPLPP